MSSHDPHHEFVRICGVPNQLEASMIEQMLADEEIQVRVTGSSGTTVFGGLPFEQGYEIFVPHSQAEKTRHLLAKHPHFQKLGEPENS